ncbi:hypothetical protein [Fusobacterium nucleatum]|jgi:hypothetical protein|uniref:hypothetical protein n=1 Tax=Fusobacterium nucleatum TaxID=851 RepID=UPI00201B27D9|nr:hypothetical protein [Fusobacterium nucleatum]MCL4591727.1 hypothetical protein [Fusobacterium nucleatum YWH7053]
MEKNLYFQDETTKIIFVLVELNGELQMKFLNIDRIHYANKKIAKNWYEEIKEKIKDAKHPKVNEAMEQLNKLYKGMGGKK